MSAEAMDLEIPENQQHLLAHWEKLDETQRDRLSSQLRSIDFELMHELFVGDDQSADWTELSAHAISPAAFRLHDANNQFTQDQFTQDQATKAGTDALAKGQLGVILVAGGQGSRLGFQHPKGLYPIGPLSDRSLLQMHIEQIRALARRYGVSMPVYLMTSPATHEDTVAFLNQHKRFGLPESDLRIFCQGTMPAIDANTGELLLEAPDRIFLSPDGHGGTLAAIDQSGCLEDIRQRGITQLFYFQVDNPLIEICQPELVGYHLLCNSELTTQVVAKQDPMEKVGNVVSVNGRTMVIEYSDLPEELADRRDADGNPIFWAGNIAVHVFAVEFLRRAAKDGDSLPFHRASKKVPFLNGSGEYVEPSAPNAIKFERFIFDLLPLANNPIVVEADAEQVFAPLKNASGAPKDTPESTRDAIVAKHKRMLEAAGATIKTGVRVEINPLFALDSDELQEKITETLFVSKDQYFDP